MAVYKSEAFRLSTLVCTVQVYVTYILKDTSTNRFIQRFLIIAYKVYLFADFVYFKAVGASVALCTVIGSHSITDGVEYGPPFKLALATLEQSG